MRRAVLLLVLAAAIGVAALWAIRGGEGGPTSESLAGARVRFVGGTRADGGVDPAAFSEATTGADGRFSFTGKVSLRELRVVARAEALAPARPDTPVHAGEDARVEMLGACALRVR